MVSDRKLAANRANAKRSTGPRTPEGKFMSRRNAIKHGLAAKEHLERIKASPEYKNLERALFDDLQPVGAAQEVLVERIASLSCRLRRVHQVEELYLRMQCKELREEAEVEDVQIEELAEDRGDETLGLYLTFQYKYTVVEQLQRYEIIYNRALNATFRQLQLLKDLAARTEACEEKLQTSGQRQEEVREISPGENTPIEPETSAPVESDPKNEIAQNEPTAADNSLQDEALQQPTGEGETGSVCCDCRRNDEPPNVSAHRSQASGRETRAKRHAGRRPVERDES
jgi:hypothetical protein